ncbi:response regulator transcription factor [Microvirga aerilata]|jgi:two-component system nitrate/nitrite response regulator NarL|uniref:Response regulator transcription factor n=1 Tax=Microvirga aerilata TaxID=670292 RepID=A0A936ZIA4_9HYPH|nr:response regulator transcription factor [Microvirga aerilata]MBL0407584.1 response regulator transcription factor [Microvirga aerilata]
MGHDVVYKEQILTIAQDPFQHVTTVLICRNTLLRTGISHILSGTRFALSEEIHDDLSSLAAFADKVPVLFLICDSLSPDEYIATVEKLKAQCTSARVVILADQVEPRAAVQICQAGLDGLCPTTMERDALIKALELVMLGEVFIPATIGLSLVDQASSGPLTKFQPLPAPMPANDPSMMLNKLSDREAQILRCLTQGASNKLIARELGVAEATVKVHIKAILRKVKAVNRTQAAMWAAGYLNSASNDITMVPGE